MATINFKCARCGGKVLEELVIDAHVCSKITSIRYEPIPNSKDYYYELEYEAGPNIYEGYVDGFQCADCGKQLAGITNPKTLYEYCKRNGMLDED